LHGPETMYITRQNIIMLGGFCLATWKEVVLIRWSKMEWKE
jgi:hypothetical protein